MARVTRNHVTVLSDPRTRRSKMEMSSSRCRFLQVSFSLMMRAQIEDNRESVRYAVRNPASRYESKPAL